MLWNGICKITWTIVLDEHCDVETFPFVANHHAEKE